MYIRIDIGDTNIRARSLRWISVVVRVMRHGHPQFYGYPSEYPSGYPHGLLSQGFQPVLVKSFTSRTLYHLTFFNPYFLLNAGLDQNA